MEPVQKSTASVAKHTSQNLDTTDVDNLYLETQLGLTKGKSLYLDKKYYGLIIMISFFFFSHIFITEGLDCHAFKQTLLSKLKPLLDQRQSREKIPVRQEPEQDRSVSRPFSLGPVSAVSVFSLRNRSLCNSMFMYS